MIKAYQQENGRRLLNLQEETRSKQNHLLFIRKHGRSQKRHEQAIENFSDKAALLDVFLFGL